MAFTAYWKTTTGFNTQDYPVIIGKKLKECSIAELTGHPMCGSNSPFGNIAYSIKSSDLAFSDVASNLTGGAMFREPITSSKSDEQISEPANTGDTAIIYRRSIFVARKTNTSIPQHSIDDTCADDIYIVDNITAPNKLVCNFTGQSGLGTGNGAAPTARIAGYDLRHTCQKGQTAYANAPNQLVYTDNTDPNNPVTTQYAIVVAFVYVVGDDAFVCIDDHVGNFGFRYKNNDTSTQYNMLDNGTNYKSFKSANDYRLFIGMNPNDTNREATLAEIFPGCFADPVPNPAVFINTFYTKNVSTIQVPTLKFRFTLSNSSIGGSTASRSLRFGLSSETGLEARLQQLCRAGTYFVFDGQVFKPIIVGGVVVGYGTPDKVSEIDSYTDLNHPVPTGPGGGGGGGSDDDPWNGVDFGGSSGGGGAFAKFYYMTSTELANLRSWMNSNSVPQGFDPMAQIIGLSQVPVAISGSAPENVMFVNSSAVYGDGQNRAVDTGVATQRGLGRTIIYNLGSVNIPRRMQQRGEPYLDYSCAIELYLPFCGVFSLDTQAVMGRTITAQLVLDPTSGSITGYAWVTQDGQKLPVAYGSGQAGVDLPITAQQYGMSKAALSQANANIGQSIVQSAVGLAVALGTSGMGAAESAGDAAYRGGRGSYGAVRNAEKSALSGEVGSYVASQASSNVVGSFMNWGRSIRELSYGNNTAINGSFGGSYASWSNPFTAYVKIIRPKFQKPSNYNHTQAVPCVEAKTVGSCTGLIQCIGVDTSSITNATSIERDAIAAALSNGVYAGGGN